MEVAFSLGICSVPGSEESEASGLLKEILQRAEAIHAGALWSVISMRTKIPRRSNPDKNFEVSGHIDLSKRLHRDNFITYLDGSKNLVPNPSDLTYYNWAIGQADFNSSTNFEVLVKKSKLYLKVSWCQRNLKLSNKCNT